MRAKERWVLKHETTVALFYLLAAYAYWKPPDES